MPRRDEIDLVLAKHFAWSFVRPEDTARVAEKLAAIAQERSAEDPAEVEPTPLPVDEQQAEEQRVRHRAACRPLAAAVAAAWATTDDDERLLATKRLLGRASRLGADIFGMDES